MKFICKKEKLERALAFAERFTGKNLALPILANILFDAGDGVLVVTATNLEHAIQISVPGSSAKPGRVSVAAKIVSSFIQSVHEENIELEEKQGNLYIKSDTRHTRINGLPAEDFPLIPKIKKNNSFVIEAALFRDGIAKVIPATSISEFKPELTGVFVKITPTEIKFAATDTFRLAEKIIQRRSEGEGVSFILPHRVALELTRVLDGDGEVRVSLGENQIVCESEGIKIISHLVEGNFPEYSAIIPKNFETSCYLNRAEVASAVRASSIFASKLQEVTLLFQGKNFEITAVNQDVGEYKTEVPAAVTGKNVSISFNHRYLLDGLNLIEDGDFFLGLNNENAPSLICSKTDKSFVYVMMPIRTS